MCESGPAAIRRFEINFNLSKAANWKLGGSIAQWLARTQLPQVRFPVFPKLSNKCTTFTTQTLGPHFKRSPGVETLFVQPNFSPGVKMCGLHTHAASFIIIYMTNFRVLAPGSGEEHRRNLVTYTRRSLSDVPQWGRRKEKLSKMKVLSRGSIEDCRGMLQVRLPNLFRSLPCQN